MTFFQSNTRTTAYPGWVMAIGVTMIITGILPIPAIYLLRRFQILKVDLDIHQGSIRRNETTASTKQMMDDDDVSTCQIDFLLNLFIYHLLIRCKVHFMMSGIFN